MLAGVLCVAIPVVLLVVAGLAFTAIAVLNTRERQGIPRKSPESAQLWRAKRLLAEAREAIRCSRITWDRKSALNRETRDLYDNIIKGVRKIDRIRRLRDLAARGTATDSAARIIQEAAAMERQLLAELDRALDVLLSVPASLMRVEVTVDDREIDRLVRNLDDTNDRMRDLADAYDEVRATSYVG